MKFSYFFYVGSFLLTSCKPGVLTENELFKAGKEDFAKELTTVSPATDSAIALKLWAPGPLLANAVAISIDNHGNAFVSQTSRRKSSYLDIREHWDWMIQDLALQTAADKTRFYKEVLSPKNSEKNEWLEDFNEDGSRDFKDLEIQKETIRRIWDEDNDGQADHSQSFVEGFNHLLGGVAGGVLAHEGKMYVTANPSLWEVSDKNNDYQGDKIISLVKGFGTHIGFAGHDLSGLTIGVDGKIYWSIGDHGLDVTGSDRKRWLFPNEGAIMRCNPDGSEFEVFAHGLRNTHEIAFDVYGNLISIDNDGDHPVENERYVHILEGSDAGWRIHWQYGKYNQYNEKYKVWMDEKLYLPHFQGQAAYILPPIALAYDGPAGLKFNPGTALSLRFKNHFFASFFTGSSANSKIQAFTLKPKGSSFSLEKEIDLVTGIVPTGLAFAPDGSLFVNDWKDSYDKKTEGRIWKMDAKLGKHPLREKTRHILSQDIKSIAVPQLVSWLSYDDQRVRLAAQFELVRKKQSKALLTLATNEKADHFGRLHSIWGLGQLGRKDYYLMKNLIPLLSDADAQIRAQTAKVIGEARYKPALVPIKKLMFDRNPLVQSRAIEAIGKIGSKSELPYLVQLLAGIKEEDPHLRHTLIFAMSRIHAEREIIQLSDHPSVFVRVAGVVALRILKSPGISKFLNDNNPLVLEEAARAIHDDLSIPQAMPLLAAKLNTSACKSDIFLRRAINANLRTGTKECANRLSRFAMDTTHRVEMRNDALWALGFWQKPPLLDRVDNYYRPQININNRLIDAQWAFAPLFNRLQKEKKPLIVASLIKTAGRLSYQKGENLIFKILKNPVADKYARQEALYALLALKSRFLPEALTFSLTDTSPNLRRIALENLHQIELSDSQKAAMLENLLDSPSELNEKQKALAALGNLKANRAEEILSKYLTLAMKKSMDPGLYLDIYLAIEHSTFTALKAKMKSLQKQWKKNDFPAYEATLFGGDAEKGKEIFIRNEAAQCLRCHAIYGQGGKVGPSLEHIADRLDRTSLLTSLINPNADIAAGYGAVLLTLKDEEELSGILIAENKQALTLKIGNKAPRIIQRADITSLEMLPSGMMNMKEVLDKSQIRDLIAFLVRLKKENDGKLF
jgi:putative membrane-bound dehydrogenase-like protein